MNVKSAVFAVESIRPHRISELSYKLPYTKHTIYKAIESLDREGLVRKRREGKEVLVELSKDYRTQKMREIYIKSLSHGIDPDLLLRESTLVIWKELTLPGTLKELQEKTNYSYLWVRNIVNFLFDSGIVLYKKKKPIIAVIDEKHELNRLLSAFTDEKKVAEPLYYEGSLPFERLIETPDEIEKILYQKIDKGLAIKNTGLVVKGAGKLSIIESTDKELTLEELFLREIKTNEGVEDFCIRLVSSGKLDWDKLLTLSKEQNMTNIVGCYLDILNSAKKMVSTTVIEEFYHEISKKKIVFLKEEKTYGKGGWEEKYEKRWNVDLYLDIGAIMHGMRSV